MPLPRIAYLGHATVLIDIAGHRVLTDPVLRDRVAFLGRAGGAAPGPGVGRVDAVLVSHLHHDHADVPSLRRIARETPLLVPVGGRAFFERLGFTTVLPMPVGATWRAPAPAAGGAELQITATPAAHDGHRAPFGPRAEAIGFLLEADGSSVYFAGDTDLFPAMADLHPSLDVALLPVWGWGPNLGPGHLDPARAAEALALLRPRHAVPIHWGTLYPVGLRRLGRRAGVLTAPPRDFAIAAGRVRPQCRVWVTEPGKVVEFGS